jgi:hypothetical protein
MCKPLLPPPTLQFGLKSLFPLHVGLTKLCIMIPAATAVDCMSPSRPPPGVSVGEGWKYFGGGHGGGGGVGRVLVSTSLPFVL